MSTPSTRITAALLPAMAVAATALLFAGTAQARQDSSRSSEHFTDQAKVLSSQAAALPTAGCDRMPDQAASLSDWLAWDLGLSAPRPHCDIPGASRWLVHWQYQGIQQRQWLAEDPGQELPVRVTLR